MHTYTGVPASTGIVVGPVEQIDHGTTGLHRIVCDPFRERALYDVAVVLAKDELRRLSQRAKGPDADILLFQIALLEDESFTNEIGDYIAAYQPDVVICIRDYEALLSRSDNGGLS